MKLYKKYHLILLSFLILSCQDDGVDWSPTFDSQDSIPYGTYVLRKELPSLFPHSKIIDIRYWLTDFEWEGHQEDLYIQIHHEISESDLEIIFEHVEYGGQAFISIAKKSKFLEKTLGIEIEEINLDEKENPDGIAIMHQDYKPHKGMTATFVSNYDEERTLLLGHLKYKGKNLPNFVKVGYGEGSILLHTDPYVFTNYNMLKSNHNEYVQKVFSFCDSRNLLWDNERIYNRRSKGGEDQGNFFKALSFVLKNDGLRQAFFLLLLMGMMFLLLNSRRKQREVSIVLPYSNHALDFAKTLANLYRSHPDHTAMTRYKINYFLEQIRVNYHIGAKDIENDFSEILHTKSGVDKDICKSLVQTIESFRKRYYFDKQDFFRIQSQIEKFNQKSESYGRKRK